MASGSPGSDFDAGARAASTVRAVPSDKRQRKRLNSQARAAAEAAARRRREARRRGIAVAIVGALVIALVVLIVAGNKGKKKSTNVASTSSTTPASTSTTAKPGATYGTTPCPKADGSSPRTTSFTSPPQKCIVDGKTYTATMTTDVGTMTIALDATKAPITVNNFVVLARYHFFDGLTFHRVIPGFVDQGGDPKGDGSGGPGYQFTDELPAAGAYKVGSLAMANSGPNTNGSQFFIIVGQQGVQLPPQYSLFGMVTQGIDVAHKIETDGGADANGTPKVVHKMVTVTITES